MDKLSVRGLAERVKKVRLFLKEGIMVLCYFMCLKKNDFNRSFLFETSHYSFTILPQLSTNTDKLFLFFL